MSLQQQHHADYHDEFMLEALKEAKHALDTFEVPVGCVFVDPKTNTIITRGHNLTNLRKNALEHAELVAIGKFQEERHKASKEKSETDNHKNNNFRIKGSHLYVTVEPCIMCASALLYHGVGKVFFGCRNPRFGGNGTILSLHDDHIGELWLNNDNDNNESGNKYIKIGYESFAGFREQEAIKLLQDFYEQENPSAPQPRVKRRVRKEDEGDREE